MCATQKHLVEKIKAARQTAHAVVKVMSSYVKETFHSIYIDSDLFSCCWVWWLCWGVTGQDTCTSWLLMNSTKMIMIKPQKISWCSLMTCLCAFCSFGPSDHKRQQRALSCFKTLFIWGLLGRDLFLGVHSFRFHPSGHIWRDVYSGGKNFTWIQTCTD